MLVMDAPILVDQYATSMYATYPIWSSEASAPIANQIADFYMKEDTHTSFTENRSYVIFINSELLNPKLDLHPSSETATLSANDAEYEGTALTLPFSSRLGEIQDRLSLSITQVAELFGVTRKSVYDWFDDKSMPRASVINRTETLLDIIKESPRDVDLSRLKTVWNIPTSGQSFLAILNDESIAVDRLKECGMQKLIELSPRLGQITVGHKDMRHGTSHIIDIDRTTDV